MAEYISKTAVVPIAPVVFFSRVTDLQGIISSVPEDKRKDIVLSGDTVSMTYSGFTISIRMAERNPFSRVVYEDVEAPFHFKVKLFLDPAESSAATTFHIEVEADLNFMMRSLLGSKIQEALDKAVDALSTGRAPF